MCRFFGSIPKKEVSAEKRTSDLRKVHTMKSMNYYVRTLISAILGGCAIGMGGIIYLIRTLVITAANAIGGMAIPLAKKLKEE